MRWTESSERHTVKIRVILRNATKRSVRISKSARSAFGAMNTPNGARLPLEGKLPTESGDEV